MATLTFLISIKRILNGKDGFKSGSSWYPQNDNSHSPTISSEGYFSQFSSLILTTALTWIEGLDVRLFTPKLPRDLLGTGDSLPTIKSIGAKTRNFRLRKLHQRTTNYKISWSKDAKIFRVS
ncbi:GL23710 [Drosophila persimilis]|uniref:GL23710 n=1 Tax=Drosophila persimilis TaxID=7234 RepID=B4G671_DROPE|nr:GL23710 [Drosophila persimilis]